jgi:hypothetical protein
MHIWLQVSRSPVRRHSRRRSWRQNYEHINFCARHSSNPRGSRRICSKPCLTWVYVGSPPDGPTTITGSSSLPGTWTCIRGFSTDYSAPVAAPPAQPTPAPGNSTGNRHFGLKFLEQDKFWNANHLRCFLGCAGSLAGRRANAGSPFTPVSLQNVGGCRRSLSPPRGVHLGE